MDSPSVDREPAPIPCRLCEGEARFHGGQTVLGKYNVAYFECTACGSLQTEAPYWLDEAYRVEGLGLDVGACQRCLNLSLEVAACLTVLDFRPDDACLDYGSGLGLFARLMRDRGFDFRAYDKYIKPFFMDRFLSTLTARKWSALTVFEVFEHMVHPATEIADLLRADPDILFFTTQVWKRQGLNWWYIVPEGGQHVFFYSEPALQAIAEKHGYVMFELSSVKVFLNQRIARVDHPLTSLEKVFYKLRRIEMARGLFLPTGALRLHLLRDRKVMRLLALALFRRHQRNSFQWTERDFNALLAAPVKLP